MKLGPVIRLDKKQNSVKKLDDDVIWGNRDVIVFRFIASLEQSGNRIADV